MTNCKDLGKHGHLLNDKGVVGLIHNHSLPKQLLWQLCGQSYFHPQLLWYMSIFLNFKRIIFIKNITRLFLCLHKLRRGSPMDVRKKNLNQNGFLHLHLQQIQNLDKACSLTHSFARIVYRSNWDTLAEQCRELCSIIS